MRNSIHTLLIQFGFMFHSVTLGQRSADSFSEGPDSTRVGFCGPWPVPLPHAAVSCSTETVGDYVQANEHGSHLVQLIYKHSNWNLIK